jgi:hypothetical protein
MKNMLCPYCLKENTIKRVEEGGRAYYICSEHAEPKIPIIYGENPKLPRDVISAIGFSGHGKTAYFASLFSSLNDLARVWPNFATLPIDEKGLDTVHDNIKLLKGGHLPSATPVNFPFPTIVQFSDMPKFKDRFLIFYDTGGENFEKASRLIANANFVKRSQTAVFFMSLTDLDYNAQEMSRLLAVYIMGLKEIGGEPKQQNLLVVLTKGDLLAPKLENRPDIWDYLVHGDTKNIQYANIKSQISDMKKISNSLKAFIREDIGAALFVSLGEKNFRAVDFCIVSALGAAPNGDQLPTAAIPKRIFDPILWVMNNSSGWRAFFFNLKNSLNNHINKFQISKPNKVLSSRPLPNKKPINLRNITKYTVFGLVLIFALLLISHPSILPNISFPELNLQPPLAPTITPVAESDAKNLAIRTYGDYLQEGQTNSYYFDFNPNNSNTKMIKVFAQTQAGNIITSAVGLNYVPSIDDNKFDYIASSSVNNPYAVIEIDNPKPGRYYVIVKGINGNGYTSVSQEVFT